MMHEDWTRVPLRVKLARWMELNRFAAVLHRGSLEEAVKRSFTSRHAANRRVVTRLQSRAHATRARSRPS